jgi:hypothetical protein
MKRYIIILATSFILIAGGNSYALIVETNTAKLIGKHDRFTQYDGYPPSVTEGIVKEVGKEFITVSTDDGYTEHVSFK